MTPEQREARLRGMRIGTWVAEGLAEAAQRDLGSEPVLETRDPAVLRKMDEMADAVRNELRGVAEANAALDRELAFIRRGVPRADNDDKPAE